jgi:hypothetical protein
VPRPAARDDEQSVDPDLVALSRITRSETLGGGDHAPQAVAIKCETGRILGRARLNLHECERPSASGDNVDFASRHARAPRQDPPAFDAEVPAGERFRAAPALFGRLAIQRIISRTRA